MIKYGWIYHIIGLDVWISISALWITYIQLNTRPRLQYLTAVFLLILVKTKPTFMSSWCGSEAVYVCSYRSYSWHSSAEGSRTAEDMAAACSVKECRNCQRESHSSSKSSGRSFPEPHIWMWQISLVKRIKHFSSTPQYLAPCSLWSSSLLHLVPPY